MYMTLLLHLDITHCGC